MPLELILNLKKSYVSSIFKQSVLKLTDRPVYTQNLQSKRFKLSKFRLSRQNLN
jgi:hypothetical protein